MSKKNRKNKEHNEQKGEAKVINGLVGSIEEAFSEDISDIEQDDVVVADVPSRINTGKIKKVLCYGISEFHNTSGRWSGQKLLVFFV